MLAQIESGYATDAVEPAFPSALRDAIVAKARPLNVRRGQVIIAEGAYSTDVYFIEKGRVQVSLLSALGKETIVRDIGPDSLFGELGAIDHKARSATVTALEDTSLAFLTGTEFLEFLETVPAAGLWIAKLFASQVRTLTDTIFELSTMPVAARFHREILRLCDEKGERIDTICIDALPTHAEFAARLGTHREAITRELGTLADLGIVKQKGRKLTIVSRLRLEAMVRRYFG